MIMMRMPILIDMSVEKNTGQNSSSIPGRKHRIEVDGTSASYCTVMMTSHTILRTIIYISNYVLTD